MAAQYGEYRVHGISSLGPFALRVTYAVSLAGNGCRGSGLLMVVSTQITACRPWDIQLWRDRVLPTGRAFAVVEAEAEAVMARKTSLWSELQRELERRQRATQARERAEQQMIRQLTRDQEQAERRAAQAEAAERKRQEQLAHDAGAAAARQMKAQLDARVTELWMLLISALPAPPRLPFAALKRVVQAAPFSPGDLGEPAPAPRWEEFAPPPPGVLGALLGGKGRHERAVTEAQEAYQAALAGHQQDEDKRVSQLGKARAAHDQMIRTLQAEVRDHNAAVDELSFLAGVPDAVEEYFTQVLALSQYPPGFPHQYRVACRPEPRELVIEYRLPPGEVIPAERDFRYVKTRREIDTLPRPEKQIRELCASVVDQIALRTMWELPRRPRGSRHRGRGGVQRDRARHQPRHRPGRRTPPHQRAGQQGHLAGLVLDQLDPASCLRHLKAIISPTPTISSPSSPSSSSSRPNTASPNQWTR